MSKFSIIVFFFRSFSNDCFVEEKRTMSKAQDTGRLKAKNVYTSQGGMQYLDESIEILHGGKRINRNWIFSSATSFRPAAIVLQPKYVLLLVASTAFSCVIDSSVVALLRMSETRK